MRKPVVMVVFVFIGLWMLGTQASSHREAPLIASDPLADNTDVYVFVDPNESGLVTFITNFIPLEFPSAGPNFHRFDDNVLYEVMIDNDGTRSRTSPSSSGSRPASGTRRPFSTTPGR